MTFTERSAPIDGRTINVAMDYTRLWEGIHERVGPDGAGVPTIGHGFALVVKVKGKWILNERNAGELQDKLGRFGVDLDPNDIKKLNEVIDALNAGDSTRAKSLARAHRFPSITGADADRLLRETITERAEMVRDRIGEDTFASLSPERRAVLIDFAYQREGRMRNIGPAVGAHLAVGNMEEAAKALANIGGGDQPRVDDNVAYFRAPYAPGVVRAQPGDGLITIAERYGLLTDKHDETGTIRRLNPHIDFDKTGAGGVTAGQFVRIAPAAPHTDIGETLKEQNMNKSKATPPDTDGSLLRELEVDVGELAPEARDILGGRLGFDTRDEARVAERRGRVEAAAEEAFFRAPGFDALPRPLGRQLFAAGLQSTPGRAADLLSIALAEAGTRPRKRRKTPGGPSVRPTLTPEIAQAVRRAEGAGRLGEVREGFALGAFRDMAVRAASDERVSRGLDGGLRRNLGLAFGESGGRPEVRAPQALHNGLVWVKGGRAAPLALDGVAGPKTRAGFTRILESIGPDRMARDMAERLRRT